MFEEILIGSFISLVLGALVGAQREYKQQRAQRRDIAGFRTFTFISLIGYFCGYLSFEIFKSEWVVVVGILGLFLLLAVGYRSTTKLYPKEVSLITESSLILVFIIGILVSLKYYQVSIVLSIFLTLILYLGTKLHEFSKRLREEEMFATLKFAIVSFVVLPFLPNKNYTLLDIPFIREIFASQELISKELLLALDVFNPYYIWLIVVLISGIAYVGYISMKTFGAEKGILLTGFLGGLMSSTALTSSFSLESKASRHLYSPLIVGVVIACSTMFFRILFELSLINPFLLGEVFWILFLMGCFGYFLAGIYFMKFNMHHKTKVDITSPFQLGPAIKFTLFFLILGFFSKLFSLLFGNAGIYFVSFFSGMADVDAITLTLASLAKEGSVSSSVAGIGITIAAFTNTMFKGGIAWYLGSKKFSRGVLLLFLLLLGFGFLFLFLSKMF